VVERSLDITFPFASSLIVRVLSVGNEASCTTTVFVPSELLISVYFFQSEWLEGLKLGYLSIGVVSNCQDRPIA